jgi:hypothetical protein
MSTPKTMSIDGVDYIRADSVKNQKANTDGLEYVIVRGDRSGVFSGFKYSLDGRSIVLLDSRRLWYWEGAASISQIAESGVSKPDKCKFPVSVSKMIILDAVEVLSATSACYESINEVAIWEK